MIAYINYHCAKIGRNYTPSVIQITGRKTNFPAIKSEKNNIHILMTGPIKKLQYSQKKLIFA